MKFKRFKVVKCIKKFIYKPAPVSTSGEGNLEIFFSLSELLRDDERDRRIFEFEDSLKSENFSFLLELLCND